MEEGQEQSDFARLIIEKPQLLNERNPTNQSAERKVAKGWFGFPDKFFRAVFLFTKGTKQGCLSNGALLLLISTDAFAFHILLYVVILSFVY